VWLYLVCCPGPGAEPLSAALLLGAGQHVALSVTADLTGQLRVRIHDHDHLSAVSSARVSPECRKAQRCKA
jgi:hypothetical protein